VEAGGRTVRTAIWKEPVTGRVPVVGVNLRGDAQADRTVHGGVDKAVYAYGIEDTEWWAEELGRPLGPGAFGENLTVSGVAASEAVIGERWEVGSTVLEVCQPRLPCYKLGVRFGDPLMVRRFAGADRPGCYFRIVREGDVGAGDEIRVVRRPEHGVTSAFVSRALLRDPSLLEAALAARELPDPLLALMAERAERRRASGAPG
jgi:MOSC domain-containing protein YiiM